MPDARLHLSAAVGTIAYVDIHPFIARLEQLIKRLQDYPQREVILELAVIWVGVYLILRFLRGSRGARAIKGMTMVLIVSTLLIKLLAADAAFERLHFLYGIFLTFAALSLIIVFQPEIRRAMVLIGEARLFRGPGWGQSRLIEPIVQSLTHLSRKRIGALIAIERRVGLKGITEGGTPMDAQVSQELLNTLFWPGSALHDMGVIIRDGRIAAAGVQFPLAEGDHFASELGSRHRAAVGLSQESDAMVLVVSEQTGQISLAYRGQLLRNLTPEQLHKHLAKSLGRSSDQESLLADAPSAESTLANGHEDDRQVQP